MTFEREGWEASAHPNPLPPATHPYTCSKCSGSYPGFLLACPDCGGWNTFTHKAGYTSASFVKPLPLAAIDSFSLRRVKCGIPQFDELLGGGFVPGSSILLIGPPGAGKSTLVMQVLRRMRVPSLYVTGEESLRQLKLRGERLRIDSNNIFLLFETNVSKIVSYVSGHQVCVLVIDSIQTMYTDTSGTLPGSATQIRKCAYTLRRLAQQKGFVLIIVGQVNKENKAAGPKLIEHAVDAVLYLEFAEQGQNSRILFASKNRYGSTLPRSLLYMRKTGLTFSLKKAASAGLKQRAGIQ